MQMIPKDLTKDIKTRLQTIEGQVNGLINMLDEEHDPEGVIIQFKAVQKGLDKTYHLLQDEVYRKTLALKIVETVEECPGNCGNEEKIESLRRQFPSLELKDLSSKMKEISKVKGQLDKYNEVNKK
jgi:CsoR family transcriptional regulator, copper-sensing transcriptional repressor